MVRLVGFDGVLFAKIVLLLILLTVLLGVAIFNCCCWLLELVDKVIRLDFFDGVDVAEGSGVDSFNLLLVFDP